MNNLKVICLKQMVWNVGLYWNDYYGHVEDFKVYIWVYM